VIGSIVTIADEFDSIIFGDKEYSLVDSLIFAKLPNLIGLSGSDLKEYHLSALE
jgi:hypothetical protein